MPLKLWDYARPAEYARPMPVVSKALRTLQSTPGHGPSLAVLGEWYAFRGQTDWAIGLLERSRKAGHSVSSLTLGRCYWRKGNAVSANREFLRALKQREAPEHYIRLCLTALARDIRRVGEDHKSARQYHMSPDRKPSLEGLRVKSLMIDRTVLVLVDDLGKPVLHKQIKRLLTEKINKLILNNKTGYKVVSYEDVLCLAASRKDYNRMGIANIARELGANQTIYVCLDEFSLKDDPSVSLWHGKLGVSVRVVDSKGKTEWPVDRPAGHSPEAAGTSQVDDPSPTYGAKVTIELADEMAAKIVGLWKTVDWTKSSKPLKGEKLGRHRKRLVRPAPPTRPATDVIIAPGASLLPTTRKGKS